MRIGDDRRYDLLVTLDDAAGKVYSGSAPAEVIAEQTPGLGTLAQLGIRHIAACSPEARGRSEHAHQHLARPAARYLGT